MSIQEPELNGITLYGYTECNGCKDILNFLNENKIVYTYIDCARFFTNGDDITPLCIFINERIRCFEEYCEQYKDTIIFPMIFKNGKFVGYSTTTEGYIKYITDN